MIQISTAIGIEIPATCILPKILGTAGRKCPISTPAIMHSSTHTVRYR